MGRLLPLLFVLCLAPCALAGEATSAADVTEPGRGLARAVRVVLGSQAQGKRTVVLLVDPTPSLAKADFLVMVERSLAQALDAQPKLAVGLAITGQKKGLRVPPTRDAATILSALREALAKPDANFRDVYAAARRVGGLLARRSGARELVLVSLDNGDAENDVEGVASALKRVKVRFSCITSEAYVADSYYVSSTRQVPRGVTLGSGDAPYVTLPWGWLFQNTIANETTPSGYAHYGLTRLAAHTGGRVFLYAPPGGKHRCAYYGSCSFCAEDHQPRDESFQAHRLKRLAPTALSRSDAGAAMARDPWFRALLKAWGLASKEGLLRSRPSVKAGGGGVRPERRVVGSWAPLVGSSLGVRRLAGKADKTRKACERIIASLRASMEGIDEAAGSPRYRAMCDFTLVMLHVTKANLLGYAAWCRDVAPALLGKVEQTIEPPEVPAITDQRRIAGINSQPMCLCHGVAPFHALHLPGGDAWRAELDALDKIVKGFMRRYAHTPYGMALRHQGLARFMFTYRGKPVTGPRPKPTSRSENETTETGRPNRGGGSTSGGSGSPTTGGG